MAGFCSGGLGDGAECRFRGIGGPVRDGGEGISEGFEVCHGGDVSEGAVDGFRVVRDVVAEEEVDGGRDILEEADFFLHDGGDGGVVAIGGQAGGFDEGFGGCGEGGVVEADEVLLIDPAAFFEVEACGCAVDGFEGEA